MFGEGFSWSGLVFFARWWCVYYWQLVTGTHLGKYVSVSKTEHGMHMGTHSWMSTHTHARTDPPSQHLESLVTINLSSNTHTHMCVCGWCSSGRTCCKRRWSNSWCHSVVLRLVPRADRWDSFTRRRESEREKGEDEKKKGKGWAATVRTEVN